MSGSRRLGSEAEDRAADYLVSLGYVLITRRYKGGIGEVDLIAMDGETLVFVEVKYRERDLPESAIDAEKGRRWHAAAAHYLAQVAEREREIRFDVVALSPMELRHHRGIMPLG
jgi:putative endonuclease